METVEETYREGTLVDIEVFFFTDNSTAEGSYYKGNSPNEYLFKLVVRLWIL